MAWRSAERWAAFTGVTDRQLAVAPSRGGPSERNGSRRLFRSLGSRSNRTGERRYERPNTGGASFGPDPGPQDREGEPPTGPSSRLAVDPRPR